MCAPRVTQHTSIRYSSSCHIHVNMGAFCSHRHSFSVNWSHHARMVLSVGGSFAYFARNARSIVTTDLLVWYSNTQNDFSPAAAIFSLHTLASPSGRNVNYDKKQLTVKKKLSCSFYLYRFRKHMSYDFLIIDFCNPGAHYGTPCMLRSSKSSRSSCSPTKAVHKFLLSPTCVMCLMSIIFAGEIIEFLTQIVRFILPSVLSADEVWPFRKRTSYQWYTWQPTTNTTCSLNYQCDLLVYK